MGFSWIREAAILLVSFLLTLDPLRHSIPTHLSMHAWLEIQKAQDYRAEVGCTLLSDIVDICI